jgi:hypothetical protein
MALCGVGRHQFFHLVARYPILGADLEKLGAVDSVCVFPVLIPEYGEFLLSLACECPPWDFVTPNMLIGRLCRACFGVSLEASGLSPMMSEIWPSALGGATL